MKCLITGAAGFVASNLSHAIQNDYKVTNVDSLRFGFKENLPEGCDFIQSDYNFLSEEYLGLFDVMVFCATSNIIYAMEHPLDTIKNNSVNAIEFLNKFKGKIIYTSTASVYGNADEFPTKENAEIKLTNSYDTSKRIVELYLQQRGNYTTLRLSNVFGARQRPENPYVGVLGKFIDCAIAGKPMEIYGTGNATRDYSSVDDVTDAIIKAIEFPALNTEINIATGIETSINDLGKMVWKAVDKPQQYTRKEPRKIDIIERRCLDIYKAKELLGWQPKISLDEGIKLTMDWMMAEKGKLVL